MKNNNNSYIQRWTTKSCMYHKAVVLIHQRMLLNSMFVCMFFFMKLLLIPPFSYLPDSAAHVDSSDSALSDYQPPAKRKYVFKNKANAPVITYSKGLCYFCPHLVHKHKNKLMRVYIWGTWQIQSRLHVFIIIIFSYV